MVVCLAWAVKKRHIFIDKKMLCETKHKNTGYCVSNHQYNSYQLDFPTHEKKEDDIRYSHSDGIIEFKSLNEQKTKIIETSICKKCLKKYNKILRKNK